jgi:hypothetical protein
MEKASLRFGLIEGRKASHNCTVNSEWVQGGLFPFGQGRSIIFVCIPGVTEREFASVVHDGQPAFAIELRQAPRFDIGHLSREVVFKWFEQAKCKYLDPAPHPCDADELKKWIRQTSDIFLSEGGRPIMFFVSTAQDTHALRSGVYEALGCSEGEWQVFEVPYPRENAV